MVPSPASRTTPRAISGPLTWRWTNTGPGTLSMTPVAATSTASLLSRSVLTSPSSTLWTTAGTAVFTTTGKPILRASAAASAGVPATACFTMGIPCPSMSLAESTGSTQPGRPLRRSGNARQVLRLVVHRREVTCLPTRRTRRCGRWHEALPARTRIAWPLPRRVEHEHPSRRGPPACVDRLVPPRQPPRPTRSTSATAVATTCTKTASTDGSAMSASTPARKPSGVAAAPRSTGFPRPATSPQAVMRH